MHAPSLTCYQDPETYETRLEGYASKIGLQCDNAAEIRMGTYMDPNTYDEKSGFALFNVTDMTFKMSSGDSYRVAPMDITDGVGMTYKVLTLEWI